MAEDERQEMEVDEVILGMQPSSNETDGGFVMCEVEEQQAARVEVQGSKRRVIRVDLEETQDCVRERLAHEDISQEEADEIGFVPIASSDFRGAVHWCDNRCSEKTLRYSQIASMVTEEGGEVRTINLCRPCHSARLVQQGKQPLKPKEWRESVERKAHRGRLWTISEVNNFCAECRSISTIKRAWAGMILADATPEKQKGIQGQWQKESLFKDVLERVNRNADTDGNATKNFYMHLQCR